MYLRDPIIVVIDPIVSAYGPFTKNKNRIQSLWRQEVSDIFTRMNWVKLVFSMIWLMEI